MDVIKHVNDHTTFFIEDLKDHLRIQCVIISNASDLTICRVITFDLKLTRKKLTKSAREAAPEEIQNFYDKLQSIYIFTKQLMFIDKTSKDGRNTFRRHARHKRDTKAVV